VVVEVGRAELGLYDRLTMMRRRSLHYSLSAAEAVALVEGYEEGGTRGRKCPAIEDRGTSLKVGVTS